MHTDYAEQIILLTHQLENARDTNRKLNRVNQEMKKALYDSFTFPKFMPGRFDAIEGANVISLMFSYMFREKNKYTAEERWPPRKAIITLINECHGGDFFGKETD